MLNIHRFDSVTVFHFSGGKEEALRVAKAIEAMPDDGLTVAVPDPRDGEKASALGARCQEASTRAQEQFGKKLRPLRGKIFDAVPDAPPPPAAARPDPDEGADEEQALARKRAEPVAPAGDGQVGAGVTVQ